MTKLNDVIKEGNKIICRKTVIDPITNQELFIQGNDYRIKYVGNTMVEIDDILKNEWIFTLDQNDPAYIWKNFISLAEWRDEQINSILDETE
jgi:hypothetical protein